MPRLLKLALLGFLAYAVATASDEQQLAMIAGGLAVRDAAVAACTREGSLCTQAVDTLAVRLSGPSSGAGDAPSPWLDDPDKRLPR